MPAHRPNVVMALPRVGKPPVSATFSGQNDTYVIWVSERRIGYQARALNRQVRPRIGVYAPYRVAEGPSPAGGTGTPPTQQDGLAGLLGYRGGDQHPEGQLVESHPGRHLNSLGAAVP